MVVVILEQAGFYWVAQKGPWSFDNRDNKTKITRGALASLNRHPAIDSKNVKW